MNKCSSTNQPLKHHFYNLPYTSTDVFGTGYYGARYASQNMSGRLSTHNNTIYKNELVNINIDRLENYLLRSSIPVIVEPDGDGYITRCPDLPLYGYGDDVLDAIISLKIEIESLYLDLIEDNNFSDDWTKVKLYLLSKIQADEK